MFYSLLHFIGWHLYRVLRNIRHLVIGFELDLNKTRVQCVTCCQCLLQMCFSLTVSGHERIWSFFHHSSDIEGIWEYFDDVICVKSSSWVSIHNSIWLTLHVYEFVYLKVHYLILSSQASSSPCLCLVYCAKVSWWKHSVITFSSLPTTFQVAGWHVCMAHHSASNTSNSGLDHPIWCPVVTPNA